MTQLARTACRRLVALAALLLVVGCNGAEPAADEPANGRMQGQEVDGASGGGAETASDPAAGSASQADADGPEAAADVVRRYFALIVQGRYAEALRMRSDDAASVESLADEFRDYSEFHTDVGKAGRIEGAAGSLYLDVPVHLSGRLTDGRAFTRNGILTLRRSNDVPGSTPEQRQWRIASASFDGVSG